MVRELEALVEDGMSKGHALRAATLNAATILGQEDRLGSLEPGKFADVLVVAGNPLDDLRALARPLMVMKGGAVEVDLLGNEDEAKGFWELLTEAPGNAERVDVWS
jgi:imidazolonepropionase-like amidohydrolase